MKKLTVLLAVAVLVLSFGIANAGDGSNIPQQYRDQYTALTGTQATFAIWVPTVLELPAYGWTNYVILSNFNNLEITVNCNFTSFGGTQAAKTYVLPALNKRIIAVGNEIGSNELYDVYCYSSNTFGLADLLFVNGMLITSLPVIYQ